MTQLRTRPGPGVARSGQPSPAAGRTGFDVVGAAFLGHPVTLTVGGPAGVLARALARLDRLAALWDVRRGDSDLHRLLVRPACVGARGARRDRAARGAHLAGGGLRARLGLPADGGGVALARSARGGLVLHPTGGWTSTSGAREQLGHR